MKYTEQEPVFSRSKILSSSVNNYQAESLNSMLRDWSNLSEWAYVCFLQNVNKPVQKMCTLPHNVERWSHELMISSISDVNSFIIFLSSLPLLSMSTVFPLLLTLVLKCQGHTFHNSHQETTKELDKISIFSVDGYMPAIICVIEFLTSSEEETTMQTSTDFLPLPNIHERRRHNMQQELETNTPKKKW